MKLPKKISPDRIRDSIVEVRYTGKHPFEILMGYFFQAIGAEFKYTNRVPTKRKLSTPLIEGMQQEILLSLNAPSFLYNEKIKIQFQHGSFVFNCLEDYVSWDSYGPMIKDALGKLFATGMIESFDRVGIRYISEYREVDMSPNINFSFSLAVGDNKFSGTTFKTEFASDDFKIILNLSNNVQIISEKQTNEGNKLANASIIDIDVIKDKIAIKELAPLNEIIEKAHSKEKEIFFNLLKEEFIKTLNPTY